MEPQLTFRYIPHGEIAPTPGGTITFEGADYGSGVSIFQVHSEPGKGPVLHRHPYTETWILREGTALFVAGDQSIEATPGDMLVVGAGTPHKFTNIGDGRLDLICIHASSKFVQENLE